MNSPVSSTTTAVAATIKSGPGQLTSVTLTAGSDAATAILYDNTAASGTVIVKLACAAANTTAHVDLSRPFVFSTGCHVALTGTAPSVTIGYI